MGVGAGAGAVVPDRLCDRRRRLYRRPSFSSLAFSTGPPQSALVDSTMSSGELGGPGDGGPGSSMSMPCVCLDFCQLLLSFHSVRPGLSIGVRVRFRNDDARSVDRAQQPSSKFARCAALLDRRPPLCTTTGALPSAARHRRLVGRPVARAYGAWRRSLDALSHRAPVGTIERGAAADPDPTSSRWQSPARASLPALPSARRAAAADAAPGRPDHGDHDQALRAERPPRLNFSD